MSWEILVKSNADVKDTINLIRDTINKYSESDFVKNLTAKLLSKYKTKDEFLKALFIYADKSVKYKRDIPGHEKVTTPKRLILDGFGDCKKFSVLIGAVLKNAGYNPVLKVVSYDGEEYSHIYIILPDGDKKYITLDPVNKHQYNKEVSHVAATIHYLNGIDMKLSLLGKPAPEAPINLQRALDSMMMREQDKSLTGLSDSLLGDLTDISGAHYTDTLNGAETFESLSGADEESFKALLGLADDSLSGEEMIYGAYVDLGAIGKRKRRKSKIWQFLKKIGLAPVRASFLLLVRINLFGLATKMKQGIKAGASSKLLKLWTRLGGKAEKLKKAIMKGAAIRERRKAKKHKVSGEDLSGAEVESLLGAIGSPPLAAVLAAAIPVVTAVLKVLKGSGVMKKGDEDSEKLAKNADVAEKNLEKNIDSGQATQQAEQVKQSYAEAAAKQPTAPAQSYQPTTNYSDYQPAPEQPTYDEYGNQVSGLGNWADIIAAVTKVVKVVAPTISVAAQSVKAIQQAAIKSNNPTIQKAGIAAEAALKQIVNAATPQAKQEANGLFNNNIKLSQQLIQQEAQAQQQAAAGSFFCWDLSSQSALAGLIVKTGLLIGYTLSQLQTIINF